MQKHPLIFWNFAEHEVHKNWRSIPGFCDVEHLILIVIYWQGRLPKRLKIGTKHSGRQARGGPVHERSHLSCYPHWAVWGFSTGSGGNGPVLLEGSDRGEVAREKGVKKQIMGFYNMDKIRLVVVWTLKQHRLKPATMSEMSVTKREILNEVFKMWAYRT